MAIGPYQMDHVDLIDEIEERCGARTGMDPKSTIFDVEARGSFPTGIVRCRPEGRSRFTLIGTLDEIMRAAGARGRRRYGGGGARAGDALKSGDPEILHQARLASSDELDPSTQPMRELTKAKPIVRRAKDVVVGDHVVVDGEWRRVNGTTKRGSGNRPRTISFSISSEPNIGHEWDRPYDRRRRTTSIEYPIDEWIAVLPRSPLEGRAVWFSNAPDEKGIILKASPSERRFLARWPGGRTTFLHVDDQLAYPWRISGGPSSTE